MDEWAAARRSLIAAGRSLAAKGFVVGSAGNLSELHGDHVVITATGADLGALTAHDVVVVDGSGRVVDGSRRPSSELALHLAVYRLGPPDAAAIAHAHAPASTAVGCTLLGELPPLHYACLQLGGPPRLAPYATFGTEELAIGVVAALGDDRTAALMQNHGSVAVAPTIAGAVADLELLEWLCRLHIAAHGLGTPRLLGAGELEEARRALRARRGAIAASSGIDRNGHPPA